MPVPVLFMISWNVLSTSENSLFLCFLFADWSKWSTRRPESFSASGVLLHIKGDVCSLALVWWQGFWWLIVKWPKEKVSVREISLLRIFARTTSKFVRYVCSHSEGKSPWTQITITFLLFGRISFALDEKGKPVESSFVKRPTVLFSKNTATAANSIKKQSGGPDRNNHVLMEFHLNKVRSVRFPAPGAADVFVTQLSSPLTTVLRWEFCVTFSKNGRWEVHSWSQGRDWTLQEKRCHCIQVNGYFALNCDTFFRKIIQKTV